MSEGSLIGKKSGIWLEVSEVHFETGDSKACSVVLKADREQPKPVYWPVDDEAAGKDALETYKSILNELDKKRVVLARLSCKEGGFLRCTAFRFQSPEMGGR